MQYSYVLQFFAGIGIVYQPVMWLIKLPIFLMLLEIFGHLRWMRYLVWVGITLTASFAISAVTVEARACLQPSANDSVASLVDVESSYACQRSNSPSVTMAALNLSIDVMLFILPIPAVCPLRLLRRQKAKVIAMFAIGLG